jgi:hypothetical protein
MYLDPHEIHKLKSQEPIGKVSQWSEIRRKAYAAQDEWRIAFEAAGKNGKSLRDVMNIQQKCPLRKLLFNPETKDKIQQRGLVNYQK